METSEWHEKSANKKRREPDFKKDDMVFISHKGLTTDSPTTHLSSQNARLFYILEQKGYSYILDLLDNY